MMIHGWCVKCRRFRRVRVQSLLMANHMPVGTCQECEDKQTKGRS